MKHNLKSLMDKEILNFLIGIVPADCLSLSKTGISADALITKYASSPSMEPGGRLNKKDGLTRYGDSHVKDKTS